ncbi:DUF1998 domain-containing protein [Mesobacillus jeotgali]|uniref:DUF1998 domain-containing protein n=1 Tax=Mesobacillus jeotgali TaxID=129985 RepID=A0ABY9VQA4_9BACI|nr:DUF1998 domain-containing protein [Mesobacillus jeotgali]WNF24835.1 DUF1998 domain-containing protein [Mesobacillus jeotgali]
MNKKVGELRPSQFITTFGPGSIVDLPDFSVIIGGIDKWNTLDVSRAAIIEEPRLKSKLKIKQIKSIPVKDNDEIGTIPAYRFPEYHVCPNCRKLGKRDGRDFFEEEGVLYCKNPESEKGPCPKVKTHPVRFITSCKNGHIQDFPWFWYVHKGPKPDSKKCKLYLIDEGKTGSLKDLVVKCSTCNKERSISEALSNKKILGKCLGGRPWLGDKEEGCEQETELLLRGASNLYFSAIESSIVIPHNSNELDDFIRSHIDFSDEELINNRPIFDMVMKRDSDILRIGLDKAWDIVQRLKDSSNMEQDIRTPEYEALLTEHNQVNDINFQTEKEEVPRRFNKFITNLIRVKRLKEVMVLKGFTRIHPLPDLTARLSEHPVSGEINDSIQLAPISKEKSDWLPGVESYGEGIFLTIDDQRLLKWEEKNKKYGQGMEVAHKKMFRERDFPNETIPAFPGLRYALLHTISHALIRELTIHSGYSSSALKERIYSDSENGIAGILIYTSTVDSEGSLGGLVELGKRDKFESILARALAASRYCSGDPQCAEHDAEQFTDVNGAACHSCMLIAETSCEKSNRYLDRSLLVDIVSNSKREFFELE